MNETTLNWLFAPDPVQAAQTRVLLDSQERDTTAALKAILDAFGNGEESLRFLHRARFYRHLALTGKIAG